MNGFPTKEQYLSFMEKMRDARISTLKLRAKGYDMQYSIDAELYDMFPELYVMEVDAESSFLALQSQEEIPTHPT